MLKSSSLCLYSSNLGTTGFFMNFELLPIMQIRKKGGGMQLFLKSSPLKLLSQSQPNFAEMIWEHSILK
jgi:hypothetical protein